jgi:YVTN family beta-propeller protein
MMSPAVAGVPTRVYVPNSEANTVDVIDPTTYKVVEHFATGALPQHVTPSWDLRTLYVDNDRGNSLTPIDPHTGLPGKPIPVDDPYNLYFTPDGSKAIVVAERLHRLDFRDPHTWKLIKSVPIGPAGVDHLDFTADGTQLVASCEFSGWLERVDLDTMQITGSLHVGGQPIDVKLSPDGTVMYVANQSRSGVSVIDPSTMREVQFIPTGSGAHGLYPSRDGKLLYVSNRAAGSISVISFATRSVIATWHIGGSPDMGGVTADGSQLWLSGRYNSVVYVIDTATGRVIHTIPVGNGPHGLDVFPQPGRYSIGHTGNYR